MDGVVDAARVMNWNCRGLVAPPETSLLYSASELVAVRFRCPELPRVHDRCQEVLSACRQLDDEVHLLRSVCYRVGNQFRNQRAFRSVGQLVTYGRRLNWPTAAQLLVTRTQQLLPPLDERLPGRLQLQHALIVCQQLSQLLLRLIGLAERCAELWMPWVRRGHHVPLALAFLSMAGRVRSLCVCICPAIVFVYDFLHPILDALKMGPCDEWLRDSLPSQLAGWLGDRYAALVASDQGHIAATASSQLPLVPVGTSARLPWQQRARELQVSLLSPRLQAQTALQVRFNDADLSEDLLGEEQVDILSGDRAGCPVVIAQPMIVTDDDIGEVIEDEIQEQETAEHLENTSGDGYNPSKKDRRLYKRLLKATRSIQSSNDITDFMNAELTSRRQHLDGSLSQKLRPKQWKEMKEGLKQRRVKLRRQEALDSGEIVECLKKLRQYVKYWCLAPMFGGRRPPWWSSMLTTS